MIIVKTIAELQDALFQQRQQAKTIGFVPTMGNLHHGHLSLVDKAKEVADIVVVSLFVNPTQFGPNEDFDSYPRTFEADCEKLHNHNTDIVFAPSVEEVYPGFAQNKTQPNLTKVHVAELGKDHCGAARPGHFDGVTTIVSKLFNMVRPDFAVFGQKDFQQLAIIRRMVQDLNIPVTIIGAPILREENGLAMSSRNGYLSQEQKDQAAGIHRVLTWAKEQLITHKLSFDSVEQSAVEQLTNQGFRVDYFNVSNADTLQVAEVSDKKLVILAAAYLGKVRLIDNVTLTI
ncbi:pantoate--beta-alanine ligase [Kangiella sp. HD9-110m-PIT-SAG06]|nr:pantoate--beta-alanine ligase [Kangiella sp. HD9-110m-PIT-SAG06]RDX36808.1 pantoate--beta-alanine ligase [Kangiella sp. HD9-110m-PIT-SAG07]